MNISENGTDKRAAHWALNMKVDLAHRQLTHLRQEIDQMNGRDEKNAVLIAAARAARDAARDKYHELNAPGDVLMERALDDDSDEHERAAWQKKWDDWRDLNRWDIEAAYERYIRLRQKVDQMIGDSLKRMDLFLETLDRLDAAEARYHELCARFDAISETCHAESV